MDKYITERLKKSCSVCGGRINLILYNDRSYRGGHYFGEIPLYRKKDLRTAKQRYNQELNGWILTGIKPYRKAEYWECPRCYRQ